MKLLKDTKCNNLNIINFSDLFNELIMDDLPTLG